MKYFIQSAIEEILETIGSFAEFIDVTLHVNFLHDCKDDFILSVAINDTADNLITVDKDLLEIKKH